MKNNAGGIDRILRILAGVVLVGLPIGFSSRQWAGTCACFRLDE